MKQWHPESEKPEPNKWVLGKHSKDRHNNRYESTPYEVMYWTGPGEWEGWMYQNGYTGTPIEWQYLED